MIAVNFRRSWVIRTAESHAIHHISSCRYNLLPVCDIIVSDNISWSKMKITHCKLIVFGTFAHQQKNSFETLFKNTSGLYQTRLALASILGPFWVYLLKFTLLTPFLHTLFFSLPLLGSHPSSLMHYLGYWNFRFDLHITTHTRRT